jgi:hypothetical protein
LQSWYEALAGFESVDDRLACAVRDGSAVALGEDRPVAGSAWVAELDQGLNVFACLGVLFIARVRILTLQDHIWLI